jgi:hypothetical protein
MTLCSSLAPNELEELKKGMVRLLLDSIRIA